MEISHPIVRIISDRRREFDNVDVDFFYESKGIKHEYSALSRSKHVDVDFFDNVNLGKFDAKSNVGIFLGYSTFSKAYRVYNQNSQVIQEFSNVVVNDTRYDQDILNNQFLT